MDIFNQIINNKILISGIFGWAAAQVLKTIIFLIVNKKFQLERLFGDGGMPSGHSATVSAVALSAGLDCGFGSPIFAVATILAIVVMHDASGVRLETGKQAKVLNEMMELMDDCMSFPKLLVRVRRYRHCILRYLDENWEEQEKRMDDDMSELIQHEYDHLDGILATMRAIDNKSFVMKK